MTAARTRRPTPAKQPQTPTNASSAPLIPSPSPPTHRRRPTNAKSAYPATRSVDPGSAQAPAVRLYGAPPYPRTPVEQGAYRYGGDEPTRRFAKAVLVHQPLTSPASPRGWATSSCRVPRAGRPSVFEYDQDELVTQLHDPRFEGDAAADITSFYSTRAGYLRRNVDALDSYGRTVKLEGALTAVLALLALAGGILGRAGARHAAALFGASAFSLALLPVAILFYDVRYAAPVVALLAAAAAIGTDRCCDLLGPRARRLREQMGRSSCIMKVISCAGPGCRHIRGKPLRRRSLFTTRRTEPARPIGGSRLK